MPEINDETTPLAAPTRTPLPKTCGLAALALIASAFLPAHPAGSFADLLSSAFQISLMDGVLILFGRFTSHAFEQCFVQFRDIDPIVFVLAERTNFFVGLFT